MDVGPVPLLSNLDIFGAKPYTFSHFCEVPQDCSLRPEGT